MTIELPYNILRGYWYEVDRLDEAMLEYPDTVFQHKTEDPDVFETHFLVPLLDVDNMLRLAKIANLCCIDLEWDPDTDFYHEDFDLHGMSFATLDENGDIIVEYYTERKDIEQIIAFLLEHQIPTTAHYGQAELTGLMGAGYKVATRTKPYKDLQVHCTAIMWNCLYEEWKNDALSLKKKLLPKLYGKERDSFGDVIQYGMDSEEFRRYGIEDGFDQLRLYLDGKELLEKHHLWNYYVGHTRHLIRFAEISVNGLPIDEDACDNMFHKFMIVRDEIERVLWQELGLSESALRSPNQLKKILFEERGMHRGFEKQLERSDKTNDFATNEGNLEILATKYEACELICAFRSIDKIISTYLTPALAHSQDFGQYNDTYFLTSNTSRTSAKFSQLMPRSGSLSEKIKFNKKLRDALSEFNVREIVAGKKHPDNPDLDEVILAVDISSNEYRWAALASEDEQMIKMYRAYSCQRCGETGESNIAMHCCPKCGAKDTEKMPTGEKTFLHGDDLHAFVRDVTNEFLLKIGKNPIDRSRAKNVSFCVVFNGSAGKLVEMLGVTWDQGNAIKEAVFERCPNLRQWQQNTEKIAEGSGEVRSILSGRRRKADYRQRIKDIAKSRRIKGDPPLTDKDKQWIKKNVVNELVNFQCQAPGTKLCMLAMEKCYKAILDKGWWDKVKIISFVHDEVVFKLPRHLAEEAKEVFVNCFETAITARLPFLADGNFGPSYADAK